MGLTFFCSLAQGDVGNRGFSNPFTVGFYCKLLSEQEETRQGEMVLSACFAFPYAQSIS